MSSCCSLDSETDGRTTGFVTARATGEIELTRDVVVDVGKMVVVVVRSAFVLCASTTSGVLFRSVVALSAGGSCCR